MSHVQVQFGRGTAAQVAAYTGPSGEIVLNTDDGSLNIQDGATAGGKWKIRSAGPAGYVYDAPVSGATITLAAGDRALIIDPAATLASLTVVLPASPADGDVFELSSSQAVTALAVAAPGGATVNGGSGLLAANGGMAWRYRLANTTWYRRY